MKKLTVNIKYLILSALLLVSINSCEKAPVPGCTDPAATNYNPDATESDGSCMYSLVGNWQVTKFTLDGSTDILAGYQFLYLDLYSSGNSNIWGTLITGETYDSWGTFSIGGSTNSEITFTTPTATGNEVETYTLTLLNGTNMAYETMTSIGFIQMELSRI
jgi:hypothetical protein